ncbi:MAG: hypothetical protein AAF902_17975, partial [Chloroflexota bacterium]
MLDQDQSEHSPQPEIQLPPIPSEPEKKNKSPQFNRMGCISAFILVALAILVCSNGNRWLFEPSTVWGESYGETFVSTLASGGTQFAILLIIGLSLIFLHRDRFKLLRGIGAGCLVAAAYTLINAVLIGRDAILPYPGIP